MPSPAEIAEGLSPGEQEALRNGKWNVAPACETLSALCIVEQQPSINWPYYIGLTPLGLAVRKALEKGG